MAGSRLEALSLLQDYTTASQAGNTEFKSCLWQLTKTRRHQHKSVLSLERSFSVDQLREELRARCLLQDTCPDLVDESDEKTTVPSWTMVDAVEELSRNKENATSTKDIKSSSGLRQRKNKEADVKPSKTTIVKDTWEEEDDKLLQMDPLQLFGGVSPTELRVAQQKAKASLQKYVEAANRVAAIQALLAKEKN